MSARPFIDVVATVHSAGEWDSPLVDNAYTIESISADATQDVGIWTVWGYGAHIKVGDVLLGEASMLLQSGRFYIVENIEYPFRHVPDRFRALIRETAIRANLEGS